MIDRPAYSASLAAAALQPLKAVPYFDEITAEWAWGGSTGRGVKVAVIDSGIDATHPAIGGPISGYVATVQSADGLAYVREPHADEYGHGTACAGIIRALAPECELYSIKVLGPTLGGDAVAFAAGLRWAIENGIRVCNLSLGSSKRQYFGLLHELSDLAYFHRIVLVTAANNLPEPSLPSLCAATISVAAHDGLDPDVFYCNPAPPIEFLARGIDVKVPWLGGQWVTASGNSYAAPHITGLVARLIAKWPDLSVFHVKAVLRALAANMSRGSRGGAATEPG